MSINETVLEMHFHRPLFNLIGNTLGLGAGSYNFYKYSPQRECFIGFDQAFIRSDLSEKDMFERLKASASTRKYELSRQFIGLFLQYKVVKSMVNRSRTLPTAITSKPYLRVSLDTKKNNITGYSQHELLFNLKDNIGAFVYYTCPMLFDRTDLYGDKPDLSMLRLVDVTSCPEDYSDNDTHFIYFNDADANPIWCSTPVEGTVFTPEQMVSAVKQDLDKEVASDERTSLWESLFSIAVETKGSEKTRILDLVHESLVIVEFVGAEET